MNGRSSEVLSKVLSLAMLAILISSCAPAATPVAAPTSAPAAPPTLAPAPTAQVAPAPSATPVPAKPTPTSPQPTVAPQPVGDKPQSGGVLRTFGTADLTNYDLAQVISYLDLHPLAPAYSLLVRADSKDINKIVSDLADRWEVSPEGKVYTFYLRRGVKFHDGTPLTSADVRASFERMIWPPKGMVSQWQAYFDAVEKIETPDENTVKFVLKRPQPAFLAIVSVPFNVVFPKALLERKGDMKKDIMGSGPFRFKEYIRGVQFVVEKNPDYFLPGLPYLDGIVRYIILDPAAVKGAFIAGRLDLLQHRVPYTEAELAILKKQVPGMVVPKAAAFALYAFIPNVTKKPWSDLRVRRAVMLALDKDALLEHHMPGGLGDRGGYMPPGPWAIPNEELLKLPGWRQTTAEDLAEAKRLLTEAGYPNGFTARFIERSIKQYVDQAVSFKGMLAKVGIDLELNVMENAAWLALRRTPNFETMGEGAVSVPMGEPDLVFTRYLSGSSGNYSQYKNPRIDELYREQSQATDPAERVKKVLEVQRIMMEDLPFMPWAWENYRAIHSPRVKGYSLPGGLMAGQSLEQVWLAQ